MIPRASPIRFIDDACQGFRDPAAPSDPARLEWYCFACCPLRRGERAYVAAGDLTDAFGNVNGRPSSDLRAAAEQPNQRFQGFWSPQAGHPFGMGRKPFRLRRLLSRSFTADRTAPGVARGAIDELNGHIDPALKDDVRLLVSEVVTNSVIHAQPHSPGEVALDVWASEEVVRVAITDRGPGFVAADLPPGGEGSGWGLMMVERLAHRWGVELDDGTEVWFEFQQGSGGRAAYAEPAAVTASADGV